MASTVFDYGDLAVFATTPFTVRADFNFLSGAILLALGILGNFFVYLMLLVKRGKGFRGCRYYSFFMVTCNLIYMANIIGNYDEFPFKTMMPDGVRKVFLDMYPATIEWFNITYCWLTTVLFCETIVRSRLNKPGFYHIVWFFLCLVLTVIPGTYMALKYTTWKYLSFDPEPYTVFHLVGYIFMILSAIGMLVSAIILIFSRKKLKSDSGTFSIAAFVGVFLYGLITIWWQIPAGYDITRSLLQTRVDPRILIDALTQVSGLVKVFTTTKDLAMLSLSAVITWCMLFFMPGISVFNVGKKNMGSVGNSSSEKNLTAP
uniref:Uncharacterized protein n=1 Tax=Panagrolaimus sp. JU765 TaxID=591449 RepID=A0AC34QYJ5_9BILA